MEEKKPKDVPVVNYVLAAAFAMAVAWGFWAAENYLGITISRSRVET